MGCEGEREGVEGVWVGVGEMWGFLGRGGRGSYDVVRMGGFFGWWGWGATYPP